MVDLKLVKLLFKRTVDVCPYKWGGKWQLGADSAVCIGKGVDCSGYVRWILDRAGVRLPDGSQVQRAYVRDTLKWRKVNYRDLRYTVKDPSRLFIAFSPRHVWLVCEGRTMESYGGHGVGSKRWYDRTGIAAECFEVPVGGRGA